MKISFSFIIPHRNSPELLVRCVESIPDRDDIEIIVVDDCSNNEFGHEITRQLEKRDVRVFYNAQCMGAGACRNIGMQNAHGTWLLFADADDYYTESINGFLDEYKNSCADVVYYNIDDSHQPYINLQGLKQCLLCYDGSTNMADIIKYKYTAPWFKMVKKHHVDKFGIYFEEIRNGNDALFTFCIGYFANKIDVSPIVNYVYDYCPNSITNVKRSASENMLGYENICKINGFYTFIGYPQWRRSILSYFKHIIRHQGVFSFIVLFLNIILTYNSMKNKTTRYVSIINSLSVR